jgi:nucleoside-diphosphate-sugar epimerase
MILVTGGAGYIGCVLVRELLDRGETVRVFDKLFFGEEPLSEFRDRIELVEGDIRSIDAAAFAGVDAVIHLAGLSNDPTAEYNPHANYEINAIASERLAKLSKRAGVKRFTFASTCSIYDRGLFADDVLVDETAEVSPRAAYAVSNYDAEKILLQLADDSFCPVILRQGTVFGYSPRMRYDLVVNTFIKDAFSTGRLTVFGGGEMWRPLVDVSDVAEAHICAVEAPEDKVHGEIFNISYRNYRILELAHWVKEALVDIRDVEIIVDYAPLKGRSYRVSTSKIESSLGFRPQVSVKDSVVNMVRQIESQSKNDFMNPVYYNIQWMTQLDRMEKTLRRVGPVFGFD